MADLQGRKEVVIRRTSFLPPAFEVVESGRTVGTVKMTSIFRNRYYLSLGSSNLTFRMPLYTVFFFAESAARIELWIRVGPSEREWSILLRPGIRHWPLIAALAFIHNERYFYG